LSAIPPAGIKVVAYTIVYAFITQEILTGLDCGKLVAILLNAAYRIVESMETKNVARLATQNTGHGEATLGGKPEKLSSNPTGEDIVVRSSSKPERFS
jgi:hypothetical protein